MKAQLTLDHTLHSYLRDVLGRMTADIVTTPGSGISQTVRRLGYAFDTAGRPYQQTSYSNTAGTGILNQVQDAYNGYGQLTAEYQNHTGAVNTSTTPKVVYGFAQPAGANYSRLSSMTYPNGRTVDDIYGGTSVISGITFSGTTATVTTATPDGLAVGSKVTISGATPSVYDGNFSVTGIIDATDFTVTLTGTPTANASGTDMSAVASQQVPIVSIIHSGTTATVTTGGTHGLTAGSSITIQGASDPTYDGTFTIATIVNSTQFTYTLPSTPGANAVGVDMLAIISTAATLDSTISRLTGMQDHVDGTVLESYQYLGLGTIAQKNRPQPGVDLSYVQQTGATGDGGDKYTGLDRFGRVDDQYWLNPSTGTVTDRFQYGYDRNSNVLYRSNLVNASFSELYHVNGSSNGYDGLNRLTNFQRGTLNGTNDSITGTPKATNAWALDALGNPTTTGGANQVFNTQDQITSITGKTTPIYDANGNMTRDEAGHTYIYDAWNRMVSAYNGTNAETIIYDADNRRPGLNICGTTITDSYYTTSWQDIEDDVVTLGCGGSTTKSTYVWSESYIDDVVARDQSVNSNPVTRVYAEQDANHDTTSLVNASGTALERFIYDPYGTRTVLNASSWSTGGDSQSWVFGYQGGRLDLTSGKINFRHRDLDTVTDTWMEKDPIGYAAGADPYQADGASPTDLVDPQGLLTSQLVEWSNDIGRKYFDPWLISKIRQFKGDSAATKAAQGIAACRSFDESLYRSTDVIRMAGELIDHPVDNFNSAAAAVDHKIDRVENAYARTDSLAIAAGELIGTNQIAAGIYGADPVTGQQLSGGWNRFNAIAGGTQQTLSAVSMMGGLAAGGVSFGNGLRQGLMGGGEDLAMGAGLGLGSNCFTAGTQVVMAESTAVAGESWLQSNRYFLAGVGLAAAGPIGYVLIRKADRRRKAAGAFADGQPNRDEDLEPVWMPLVPAAWAVERITLLRQWREAVAVSARPPFALEALGARW